MKALTLYDDIPEEEKIFTPKARRIIPKKNKFKRYDSIDSNNFKFVTIKNSTNTNEKSMDLEKISLEEINKDFQFWNESLDEEKCYDEISNILSSSTKDCSFNSQYKKTKKIIERPNCPMDKNLNFFYDIDIFNLMDKPEI